MAEVIKVLIADDDALVRSALAMMLGGADGIEIVGQVGDGDEVAGAVDAHTPHVVLMDIRMPRMDGLAATELLRARAGAPEILVLTTFDADDQVLRALRAGASGYLLKDAPPADIAEAVRRVAAGRPCSPRPSPASSSRTWPRRNQRTTRGAGGRWHGWTGSATASGRSPSPWAAGCPTPTSAPSST